MKNKKILFWGIALLIVLLSTITASKIFAKTFVLIFRKNVNLVRIFDKTDNPDTIYNYMKKKKVSFYNDLIFILAYNKNENSFFSYVCSPLSALRMLSKEKYYYIVKKYALVEPLPCISYDFYNLSKNLCKSLHSYRTPCKCFDNNKNCCITFSINKLRSEKTRKRGWELVRSLSKGLTYLAKEDLNLYKHDLKKHPDFLFWYLFSPVITGIYGRPTIDFILNKSAKPIYYIKTLAQNSYTKKIPVTVLNITKFLQKNNNNFTEALCYMMLRYKNQLKKQ